MPTYNFKAMQVVPSSKDFIDIVLSKTQRQTPTVVHNGWEIQRIRQFYMRKVKFTCTNWHDKLTAILTEFPKVEDIHPFYSDLLNVLYDKDHYKLALGQLNTARNLIDKVSQDYVRLLKYGDSLYRCKELKRAALGRMCTLMRKQAPSLAYLEQVRQHMSRLPSIDPNTRSLLLCGYPNVGKSSLMNKLTRADVEVQPYAFTTKSLYVGHMDYKYLRWQVIDTPGILDRPLEERNTIEMQSITALAHLRAAVLYIVDLSEQCGYSLEKQAALFHSIKPLFANKPVLVVCNKMDQRPLEALSPAERAIVDDMVLEARKLANGGLAMEEAVMGEVEEQVLMCMSTLTDDGVMDVKTAAADRLLSYRVEMKVPGKRIQDILNRIHVAMPKPRGGQRPPCIPASVLQARQAKAGAERRKLEKDAQEEQGGAGVYSADLRKHYLLANDEWKNDIFPEIVDGHNVMDFVDPDIEARLAELEREEDELQAQHEALNLGEMEEDELDEEQAQDLAAIRRKKKVVVMQHRIKKNAANNQPVMPRRAGGQGTLTSANMRKELGSMGIDTTAAVERLRGRSLSRTRKRTRSESAAGGDEEMGDTEGGTPKRVHSSKSRSMSHGRAMSLSKPSPGSGIKDATMRNKASKMADRAQRRMNKLAKAGEADRVIPTKMPKHLFSGKRGKGKTDYR